MSRARRSTDRRSSMTPGGERCGQQRRREDSLRRAGAIVARRGARHCRRDPRRRRCSSPTTRSRLEPGSVGSGTRPRIDDRLLGMTVVGRSPRPWTAASAGSTSPSGPRRPSPRYADTGPPTASTRGARARPPLTFHDPPGGVLRAAGRAGTRTIPVRGARLDNRYRLGRAVGRRARTRANGPRRRARPAPSRSRSPNGRHGDR